MEHKSFQNILSYSPQIIQICTDWDTDYFVWDEALSESKIDSKHICD